jgi:DMSO/TMAO reductase YedYZ molybdopterin-dependent catalytic subunit
MSVRRAPVAGSLAAAAALAVSELAAGIVGLPSLLEAIGDLVIESVPPAIKDFAIDVFGVYDKLALIIGMVLVIIALGAVVGHLAPRLKWLGPTVFVLFGLLASFAAGSQPVYGYTEAFIASGVAVIAGLWVMAFLQRTPVQPDVARRAFLRSAGAVAALVVVVGWSGRVLLERAKRVAAGRGEVGLPLPIEAVGAPSPAASLAVEGVSPIVVPNEDFYRIDTALSVPNIDLSTWRLAVTGMVDRPYQISYDELLELPMIERYVTLSCVSNQVGGDLVGNAKWLGVPLGEILERAGVDPSAEQVVGRSAANNNFTVGFPVEAVFDGREALLAVGMNGEPLPFEHGFPARLVVSGLYGYVSATKWISEIELTSWDGFDAYWVPRGWAKEAPVKTQSRIDVPARGSRMGPGPRMIAGVAWAPHRGISKVEVQVDGGDWMEATLSEALSRDAWRQWAIEYDFGPGNHAIRVRAADGGGAFQDEIRRPPAPDGATGWHTIGVVVE